MNDDELVDRVNSFRFWYHKIDLGNGITTPGLDLDEIWKMIRSVRNSIDYKDKAVLDIASFDGMWAFEAEKLGASSVVATDVYRETFRNFLFCREMLRSDVLPYFNVSPYNLVDRLDVYMQEDLDSVSSQETSNTPGLFDIVQHLGLYYHLRDPLYSLSQARSLLKTGGYLLIETAVLIDEKRSVMAFNGPPPNPANIYPDLTTWFAPSVSALFDHLQASLFEPISETLQILPMSARSKLSSKYSSFVSGNAKFPVSRAAIVARAVDPDSVDQEYVKELYRTYRNPGLVPHLIERGL